MRTSPSGTTLMSADVPPISTVIRCARRHVPRPLATDDAASGPGHQDRHRALGRAGKRGHATVGLHDANLGIDAILLQRRRQIVEIEGRAGADEGVHRRRREALVFPDHVNHLGGAADVGIGNHLLDDLLGAPLVRIVQKGEEEADDDGIHVACIEQLGGGARTSSSSSAVSTLPSGGRMRSVIGMRFRRLTSGRDCQGTSNCTEKLWGRLCRAMCRMSRKPVW